MTYQNLKIILKFVLKITMFDLIIACRILGFVCKTLKFGFFCDFAKHG